MRLFPRSSPDVRARRRRAWPCALAIVTLWGPASAAAATDGPPTDPPEAGDEEPATAGDPEGAPPSDAAPVETEEAPPSDADTVEPKGVAPHDVAPVGDAQTESPEQADTVPAEDVEALRAEVAQLQARVDELAADQDETNQSFRDRLKALDALRFYGDFRYRFEHDWDSRNDDGSFRKDRFRMRYRLRLGFEYAPTEHIYFGGRIRTGVPTNMQSPHVNVGYNGFGLAPLNVDRAYLGGKYDYVWWWFGKNRFPLWKQNELFWDDDVMPAGVAVGGTIPAGRRVAINPTVAYFVPNHEQVLEYPNAHMAMGQVHVVVEAGRLVTVDVASAYLHLNRIFVTPQHLEREFLWSTGGDTPDRLRYQFLVSGARVKVATNIRKYPLPVSVGVDHVVNLADYGDNGVPAHYRDQKSLYVGHVRVGQLTALGEVLLGYYYTHKEKYSVVDYYGEDDWVRWGNIHRNRNTNYSGHEVRAAVAFGRRLNAVLRFYAVEALVARLENDATHTESGNRVRLDFNARF